ncbi:MAG: biotin--[acetyl-CoA-carboxylase] ligase [Chitinophagaceae bacterium]|nr:biotin--[acetyl-CoA-carboxylase] ligase [Chitinophagaceae bacterium]
MHPNMQKLIILDRVDSTNNYAMGMIHEGLAEHGSACFALEQTAGKGRRGKEWKSEAGKNIIISIILNMQPVNVYRQFELSIIASLACYDFLKKYVKNNLKIKWPNDLFWNDSKAGGILIESVIKGEIWQYAVIGIGININQLLFNYQHPGAVSIQQITGEEYNVLDMAEDIRAILVSKYEELKQNGIREFFTEYNQLLYKLNENVRLKKDNAIFETTIKGISPFGQLMTFDTIERVFDFDEVVWC